MAKIMEQARDDLQRAFTQSDRRNIGLFDAAMWMQRYGWETVTRENVADTARALGFPVVGNLIYELDA